jgi:hypothetical protein
VLLNSSVGAKQTICDVSDRICPASGPFGLKPSSAFGLSLLFVFVSIDLIHIAVMVDLWVWLDLPTAEGHV